MDTPFPSRELLLAITDVAQDLNGAVTPDGTVVYVSAAISRIVGFDTEEAVGTSMFRFIAPDDHGSVQSALTTVAAGSSVQFRCHLLDQRDQPRLVEVRARPAQVDGAQYLVFSARDATDALHAEKARAESEVRFRRLMDAAPDAMVVIQD
ncbi:MAG: PAS domain-containing protein, partial [Abyssibacter sp.]|uniref:PAS domain-containing protein n=1 Tax=Abyssibacter sp. TaxID=2320200 RepID=UPI00321ABBA6